MCIRIYIGIHICIGLTRYVTITITIESYTNLLTHVHRCAPVANQWADASLLGSNTHTHIYIYICEYREIRCWVNPIYLPIYTGSLWPRLYWWTPVRSLLRPLLGPPVLLIYTCIYLYTCIHRSRSSYNLTIYPPTQVRLGRDSIGGRQSGRFSDRFSGHQSYSYIHVYTCIT